MCWQYSCMQPERMHRLRRGFNSHKPQVGRHATSVMKVILGAITGTAPSKQRTAFFTGQLSCKWAEHKTPSSLSANLHLCTKPSSLVLILPLVCSNLVFCQTKCTYVELWLYLVDAITSGIYKLGAAVEVMQPRILPCQLLHAHPVRLA